MLSGVRSRSPTGKAMVKSHPWMSLSIAAVVGYLLVPKRDRAGAHDRDHEHAKPAARAGRPVVRRTEPRAPGGSWEPPSDLAGPGRGAGRSKLCARTGREHGCPNIPCRRPADRPDSRPTHEAGKSARAGLGQPASRIWLSRAITLWDRISRKSLHIMTAYHKLSTASEARQRSRFHVAVPAGVRIRPASGRAAADACGNRQDRRY